MLRILLINDTAKKVGRLKAALTEAGFEVIDESGLTIDLPARVEPRDVLLIAGTAFALCCLSTVYPAWRAATTDPARALRHD